MFTRQEVFTEDFLPREMPGRARELRRLSDVLRPATRSEPAESCWEIGPSGAGKTSSARYLLRDLRDNWGVRSTLVECVGATHWELLRDIAAAHPRVPQHRGLGKDDLIDSLERNTEEPFIVILDEFDGLEHPEVLEDLVDIEWLSLICIGHEREEALGMVPDPADSLRFARVVDFQPYNVTALLRILEARREEGLRTDAVNDDQLERIAEEVGGSARFAVQALRSAVELGLERGHTVVEDEDVDDAFAHAKDRIRKQLLSSLSRDHHLVYRVIREAGGLRAKGIFEGYREAGGKSGSRQAVLKYRKKLARYELIEEVDGEWVVVDDTLRAPLREQRPA